MCSPRGLSPFSLLKARPGVHMVWHVPVVYDELCSLSQRWPWHPSVLGLPPPRTDVGHIRTASRSVLSRKSAKAGWSWYRNKNCNMLVTSDSCREIFSCLGVVEFWKSKQTNVFWLWCLYEKAREEMRKTLKWVKSRVPRVVFFWFFFSVKSCFLSLRLS